MEQAEGSKERREGSFSTEVPGKRVKGRRKQKPETRRCQRKEPLVPLGCLLPRPKAINRIGQLNYN